MNVEMDLCLSRLNRRRIHFPDAMTTQLSQKDMQASPDPVLDGDELMRLESLHARNPDPVQYQPRTKPTFSAETVHALGLVESPWEPRVRYGDALTGTSSKPLSLPADLRGYRPLRLWFALPHPTYEMNDDWFEVLFKTLRALAGAFAEEFFSANVVLPVADDGGPWAKPAFSPTFLHYAGGIARKDVHGGGWDMLMADPEQRAYVAQGVLARALDEHVFAELLFGGTRAQQDALAQWDRLMLKEEGELFFSFAFVYLFQGVPPADDAPGYKRKFKRCEEVQYFLGGHTVSPRFWAEVDRVTAQTAALLLPLLNVVRQALETATTPGERPHEAASPILFYQRLHDVVALAGYASLCMAWSTSIFQVVFPELGQLWAVDQERVGNDSTYRFSASAARRHDERQQERKQKLAFGGDAKHAHQRPLPLRTAKVKIVLWPRITRYRPQWNSRNTTLINASRTVVARSLNAYYSGRMPDSRPENAEDNEGEDEEWPDLPAHVEAAHKRRTSHRYKPVLWPLALFLSSIALAVLLYMLANESIAALRNSPTWQAAKIRGDRMRSATNHRLAASHS